MVNKNRRKLLQRQSRGCDFEIHVLFRLISEQCLNVLSILLGYITFIITCIVT